MFLDLETQDSLGRHRDCFARRYVGGPWLFRALWPSCRKVTGSILRSAKFGCLEKRSSIYVYIYIYIYMSYIRVQTPNFKIAVNNQASGKRKVPIDIRTLWPPRLSD